mgnify:CR=1 FL=1
MSLIRLSADNPASLLAAAILIIVLGVIGIATLPIQMRRSAVNAFRDAVKRRGLMLQSRAVNQQYDRYNQTRTLPKETQQLLAEVLDIIEGALPPATLLGSG